MSKTSRISLALAVVLLAALALWLAGSCWQSRNSVREYRAQLHAQGEKLTLAGLMSSRDTNSHSSPTLLTNAVSGLGGLRLQPGGLTLRKFVGPGQARCAWMEDGPNWTAHMARPDLRTWEAFAAEAKGADDALQQLRDLLKDPALDAGPPTNLLGLLRTSRVNFVALRIAAQWLAAISVSDLHEGRVEEALQNLESEAALARLYRDEYSLVAQMIRIAIANLGLSATWEALQAPGWTEPQLARLQRAWEPVDLLEALEKGYLGTRAVGADLRDGLRGPQSRQVWAAVLPAGSGSGSARAPFERALRDGVLLPAYKLTSMDRDELFYLQTMQHYIEAARLLKAHRSWKETKPKLDGIAAQANRTLSSPASRVRYLISAMAIPNYAKADQTAVHAETERQMTIAAIALERYRLAHGQWPERLENLVPEFLSVLPYDPMSGQPLHYRLKPQDGFVLYSVGDDGSDDGGDPTPSSPGKFDFWQARDALWPAVARKETKPVPK